MFTFFIVSIKMTGFIAEGDGVNDYGILLSVGWIVGLLMTFYTHKKKSKRWFILTIIAGWLLPIANIYIYGYVSDVVERLF
ncbi:hypothetical protein [Sinobaca qinghaiensis]|nr:hypothetical protein [Sinobaca qinghaiensis]